MKLEKNRIEIKGKKALVVGMGVSGFYSAQWLAKEGAKVVVTDSGDEASLNKEFSEELKKLGVILETGNHSEKFFLDSEIIIVSPGVPHNLSWIVTASKKGIPVIGELELASLVVDIPLIAVTGTNGKSTVTSMLGKLLEKAGFDIFVGGNIGIPLIAYATSGRSSEYAVVEVSSFQLDTINTFCPFISIILNITPDHLDRYDDFESYFRSKLRIYMNQREGQYLIINDDDEKLTGIYPKSGVRALRYGFEEKESRNSFLKDRVIICKLEDGRRINIPVSSRLLGKHNLSNMMAVALAGCILGVDGSVISKSINEFKGLHNRLEWVGDIGDVEFFNDSKATNLDSAIKAVISMERQLVLIAGGLHKGADYGPLVDACKGKVKHCVFIGKAKELLADAFSGFISFDMAGDMDEAVSIAFSSAMPGDAVLLAPACSSFDMYKDYADRGRAFRTAVKRLKIDQRKYN